MLAFATTRLFLNPFINFQSLQTSGKYDRHSLKHTIPTFNKKNIGMGCFIHISMRKSEANPYSIIYFVTQEVILTVWYLCRITHQITKSQNLFDCSCENACVRVCMYMLKKIAGVSDEIWADDSLLGGSRLLHLANNVAAQTSSLWHIGFQFEYNKQRLTEKSIEQTFNVNLMKQQKWLVFLSSEQDGMAASNSKASQLASWLSLYT